MSRFGWCNGPVDAVGPHDVCPGEISQTGTTLTCGCPCHTDPRPSAPSPARGRATNQEDQ